MRMEIVGSRFTVDNYKYKKGFCNKDKSFFPYVFLAFRDVTYQHYFSIFGYTRITFRFAPLCEIQEQNTQLFVVNFKKNIFFWIV